MLFTEQKFYISPQIYDLYIKYYFTGKFREKNYDWLI